MTQIANDKGAVCELLLLCLVWSFSRARYARDSLESQSASTGHAVQYSDEIALAEKLGRRVFEHDRAALLATDHLLKLVKQSHREGLSGWIEERLNNDDLRVTFYSRSSGEFIPRYTIDTRDGQLLAGSFVKHQSVDELTSDQLKLVKARECAGAKKMF